MNNINYKRNLRDRLNLYQKNLPNCAIYIQHPIRQISHLAQSQEIKFKRLIYIVFMLVQFRLIIKCFYYYYYLQFLHRPKYRLFEATLKQENNGNM